MNRFAHRSALRSALSSLAAVATVALAGPAFAAGDDDAVMRRLADHDEAQQPQPDSTGTPAQQGGTGSAAPVAPQPAVQVGTGTASGNQGRDQAQAETVAEAPKKPRPWAGTQVFLTSSMSTNTVFVGQQQDPNPTVDGNLWLLPRYTLSKDFQLRGRLIATYEFTNSDTTVRNHEPRLSDTTVQLFYRGIPEVVGFKPLVGVNVGLPTSPESRARTVYFTPGATLQLARPIEHVLGGEVLVMLAGIYSHPIYGSTTPTIRGDAPYDFQCGFGGSSCRTQLGGLMNVSDSISGLFLLAGEWGKFSPAVYYLSGHAFTYAPKDAAIDVAGNEVAVPRDANATRLRQSSYFSAWIDYHLNSWATPEVGYFMARNILNADGTFGNPIWDTRQDMRVYLGLNINIDNILQKLEGQKGEAGVVRAKTERRPIMQY